MWAFLLPIFVILEILIYTQRLQERSSLSLNIGMNESVLKMKAGWAEYINEEVSDERATEVYGNTLAFIRQVVHMKELIDKKESEENDMKLKLTERRNEYDMQL